MSNLLTYAIADTLRSIRLGQGKSLRQVSRQSNIALGYLSEVERGMKEPSHAVLNNLAETLDLSLSQLLKEIYEYLESVQ